MFHPNGPKLFELIRAALSPLERGYDLIASKFDYTPFRTPDLVLSAVAPHIGKAESVGAALDICCGSGAGMQMLRPLCKDRLVGIDISQGLLDVARLRTAEANGKAPLEFVHCNALDMPFNSQFDVAACFGALVHISKKTRLRFLDKVAAALKPGGRFVFVTYCMPSIWSGRYWFYRAFNAVGLLRNLLVPTSLPMNKLTFLLPEVKTLLEDKGFDVSIKDAFEGDLSYLKLVIATKAC